VPVHPYTVGVPQDRPAVAAVDGTLDGPSNCGRQRDQHSLVARAANLEYAVAMFLAEVVDVRAAGLKDPQAEQAQHRDQCEVVDVRRQSGRGDQCLELQVSEPEGGQQRISCSQRTYRTMSTRPTRIGSELWPAHQVKKMSRSEPVCRRDWPRNVPGKRPLPHGERGRPK
jgi:hypothetical protein